LGVPFSPRCVGGIDPEATAGRHIRNVVPIGGTAADIALDEARGVLYIANSAPTRIDVMSLQDKTIKTSTMSRRSLALWLYPRTGSTW